MLSIVKIYMLSTINFEKFDKLEIISWKNKNLLIIQQESVSRYIIVPTKINCVIKLKSVEVSCLLEKRFLGYNAFINVLTEIKNCKIFLFKQKLFLKGLGYRCNVDLEKKNLLFKIGLSHILTINIPNYVKNIVVKKTFLLFESTDKILLGNFMNKIYKLKESDIYKGKVFSFPYKKKKLKLIKKK